LGVVLSLKIANHSPRAAKVLQNYFFPWHPAGVYSPAPAGSIKEPNIVFHVTSELIRLILNPLLLAFGLIGPAPLFITSTFHS